MKGRPFGFGAVRTPRYYHITRTGSVERENPARLPLPASRRASLSILRQASASLYQIISYRAGRKTDSAFLP